jgi:hypothetical protein
MNNYNSFIEEIEDFIPCNNQNSLEKYVTSHNFKWSYYEGTILKSDIQYTNSCIVEQGFNPPQFSHFVDLKYDSNIIFIRPILDNLSYHFNKNLKILKCKYNLLTKSNNNNHHYPHSDLDDFKNNIFTAIYYINDTDGETYLFNEFAPKLNDEISVIKKINPKKGKILIFDSRRLHASSSPQLNNIRLVLNIVFGV